MQPDRQPIHKRSWKPGNMLCPVPAVLVSCGSGESANLITVAWAGTVCTNPPMLSISVRPERHSYDLIRESGEFTVNVPTVNEARAVDWCGVASGREHDKFAKTGLTPAPGEKNSCPSVLEGPVNIECRVRQTIELGSHTLFIADVVAVQVSEHLIDAKEKLCLEKAGLLAYVHGEYMTLGKVLGHFGWSVRKRKPKTNRRNPPRQRTGGRR